ncbi:hypothetical protein K432DRAFT_218416 [Lepidopterella palustris CBS 459.81]|uniref:Uncharacterized protein n=1 Tax=Lepidopterella palustris CBS 459.81 TaxID=1314670 RepID=A0A8E2EEQ6_9PEZI|nr:hypothetical protein K432DRAFT_218416 [Lepidopterella palustris CBS 459.81]
MKMHTALMKAYVKSCGIEFKVGGEVENTIDAHPVVQWVQETRGEAAVLRLIESLYSQYFENEKHPSLVETLLTATTAAGVPEKETRAFIEDEYGGLQEVKMLIREQAGNVVDAVPHVIVEGKKRGFHVAGSTGGGGVY